MNNSFSIVLILFLFLVDENCGQSHLYPRDCGVFDRRVGGINGMHPFSQAWSWLAEIAMRNRDGSYDHLCSAVLITGRHLLSAAHCFNRRDPSLYLARIGNVDITKALEYNITQIKVPATYVRTLFDDDIAVLTLSTDVKSRNVGPICLPEKAKSVDLEERVTTVVGWKFRNSGSRNKRPRIEICDVSAISNKECEDTYSSKIPGFRRHFRQGITDSFYCIVGVENIHCQVGSGSPLMYMKQDRWYVAGLAAFGVGGNPSLPEGYTKVSNYLDWIQQNIQN